jgi:hypothetical protein
MFHALYATALAGSLILAPQDDPPSGRRTILANDLVYSGREGNLDVAVPQIGEPQVRIDGRLDEPIWQQAALLKDFTQFEPVEGIPSTEATEVYVFYSSDAIYFGIRAWDREPDLILARLAERDRSVRVDDWVRLTLDTFDDQRQAYIFYVNPLGSQTDGLWIEGMRRWRGFGGGGGGGSVDFNPDFIWESNGRLNDEGWAAEVRIPYVSLRFREVAVQDWGFNVTREVKRRGFKQAWAPLTKNVSSTLAQSGHLVGLRDLRSRRLVEINPVATGKRTGQVTSGEFTHDDFDPDLGVNGRLGITQNFVLDATVNPDFSQVEADPNRLTVNERFALFFPEKRTFFLEGAEIFRTPRNLVHTRTIEDPSAGAKLTGKFGAFNVGYLGAVDESPKTLYERDRAAVFNLLRLRRDVGSGSTVGVLYTDRTLTDRRTYNRVASADVRLLLGGRYTVAAQFAGAWTGDTVTNSVRMKPMSYLRISKSGRSFSWNAQFDDVHPEFHTASGFIPRVGDVNTQGNVTFTKFGRAGAVLERTSFTLRGDAFFDHDEFWDRSSPFEGEVEIHSNLSFKGDRSVNLVLRDGYFRFRPEDYAHYLVRGSDGDPVPFVVPPALRHMMGVALTPRARVTNQVQLNGRMYFREVPLFQEAARGFEVQIGPDLTVRPNASLQLSLSHTYSQLWRRRDNSGFSTVHLSRFRTQYQFNKALFVRMLVQYELEHRGTLRDPTTERPILIDGVEASERNVGEFQGQLLLQYQPSPGTICVVGYTGIMEGERTYRFTRMDPTQDALFAKLSYLFRL